MELYEREAVSEKVSYLVHLLGPLCHGQTQCDRHTARRVDILEVEGIVVAKENKVV